MNTTSHAAASETVGQRLSRKFRDAETGALVTVAIGIIFLLLMPLYGLYKGAAWILGKLDQMTRTLIPIVILAIAGFAWTMAHATDISGIAVLPLKAVIGVTLLYLITHYGDPIDTLKEIADGNDALARYYQNYAIIIAAALFGL